MEHMLARIASVHACMYVLAYVRVGMYVCMRVGHRRRGGSAARRAGGALPQRLGKAAAAPEFILPKALKSLRSFTFSCLGPCRRAAAAPRRHAAAARRLIEHFEKHLTFEEAARRLLKILIKQKKRRRAASSNK